MDKELKWTAILLLISLISGGASVVLVEGITYETIYAIHKIFSVAAAILFIIAIRRMGKKLSI